MDINTRAKFQVVAIALVCTTGVSARAMAGDVAAAKLGSNATKTVLGAAVKSGATSLDRKIGNSEKVRGWSQSDSKGKRIAGSILQVTDGKKGLFSLLADAVQLKLTDSSAGLPDSATATVTEDTAPELRHTEAENSRQKANTANRINGKLSRSVQ